MCSARDGCTDELRVMHDGDSVINGPGRDHEEPPKSVGEQIIVERVTFRVLILKFLF